MDVTSRQLIYIVGEFVQCYTCSSGHACQVSSIGSSTPDPALPSHRGCLQGPGLKEIVLDVPKLYMYKTPERSVSSVRQHLLSTPSERKSATDPHCLKNCDAEE